MDMDPLTTDSSAHSSFGRLVTIMVALIVTILCALFAWKVHEERQLAIGAAEGKGRAYARALKEHAERTFGQIDATLFSISDQVAADPRLLSLPPEKLKGYLADHVKRLPVIASLVLVDSEGLLWANSYESVRQQIDVSDRAYVIHHRNNPSDPSPYVSPPFRSRITGKWRFTLSRPLTDRSGRFLGIVAAAVDIDYFNRFYSSLDLGQGGKILIVRNDGRLVIVEPFRESDLSTDFSRSHLLTKHLPQSPRGLFHIPAGKALLESDARIVAYESLESFPLTVLVSQSLDTVLIPWRNNNLGVGIIFAGAIAIILTLALFLTRQVRRIQQAQELAVAQQKEIETSASDWQTTFDSVDDAIWVMDADRRIKRCNRATERLLGMSVDQIVGKTCHQLVHADAFPPCECPFEKVFEAGQRTSMELQLNDRWFSVTVDPIIDAMGKIVGAVHIMSDITRRKEEAAERELLEQQLAQARKLEAIGQLAGGIAHDFNNILTPIMGYAEMASSELDPASTVATRIAGILSAAKRARALTHQLLSFSRKGSAEIEPLDLNEVVLSFNEMLRRTIRENIRIELDLDPDGAPVRGDRVKMEQVLLNLAVNAQDAIGDKPGVIRISTARVTMEGEQVLLNPGMIPGDYILMAVRDSGCGIPPEAMSHIFEPFYTTKGPGHGTGLGLATVYGIVRQHNGFIGVDSMVGEGTTLRIYLPVDTKGVQTVSPLHPIPTRRPLGTGTIMLVEDDQTVREMLADMLVRVGYRIETFADPREALAAASEAPHTFDLLISDMVMPGMSGQELYERMLLEHPDLKVIFISGYPAQPVRRGSSVEVDFSYIQKPFTSEALLERIRELL